MVKVVEVVKVVKVVKVKVVMMLKLMAKAVTAARTISNFGKRSPSSLCHDIDVS